MNAVNAAAGATMAAAPLTAPDGLVETYRGTVYPWHCDHMGHMNVMWYVGKFDEATWNLFALLGLSGPVAVPTRGRRCGRSSGQAIQAFPTTAGC